MIVVACLLLPLVGLLLYGMDRIEERLLRGASPEADAPRHARRRHLRLVRGSRRYAAEVPPATEALAAEAFATEVAAAEVFAAEAPPTGVPASATAGAPAAAPSRASADASPSDRRRAHRRDRFHGRRRERRDRRLHTAA
ncbi:hypothetical protein [Streptomyces sp. NPDC017941]|uniref:hypothetical protein n=1 Tax=Streptomyces sp. NPDC017941 TaxID=3365018 RepID=UPI0037B3D442